MKVFEIVVALLLALIIGAIAGLICSLPVYFLWNGCLVGAVAGISTVSWLQAWGISVLCSLLFNTTVTTGK